MNKSKFSNCNLCPLLNQEIVIGETNNPYDLKDIDLLVLAEAPASKEVDLNRPLIGKAGKIFRRSFKISKLETLPHYIGNIVFCANLYIDQKTGKRKTNNPPKSAVELCKPNWKMLIKILQPKYIFALGSSVKNVFNINGSMDETRGKFYKYDGSKLGLSYNPEILVTYHPSFIGRGVATSKQIKNFEDDFNLLYSTITGEEIVSKSSDINRDKLKLKNPYFYKMPSWMKKDDVMLVDIQNQPSSNKVIYIFRDKDGNRKYHIDDSGEYYYYRGEGTLQDSPVINSIKDVELIQGQCIEDPSISLYEGDVKIEMKHSIDYYIQKTDGDPNFPLKKMFFDIEVYTHGEKAFPDPKLAKKPVSAISFKINDGPLSVFMVNPYNLIDKCAEIYNLSEEDIRDMNLDFNVEIFKDERTLLRAFSKEISKSEVDLICGWNCINKNENIWLNDRILNIGNCYKGLKLSNNYGYIERYKDTGLKKGFELNLCGGFKIITSKNHIFPIYIKGKNKYKYPSTLMKTERTLKVDEIIKCKDDYDIYFKIDRHSNNNVDYTYRDYLIENIEHILSFDDIDISIKDEIIFNRLKNNKTVRNIININDYWNRKDFYKRSSRWSYKTLKEFITIGDIIEQIKKYDIQSFIIKGFRKNRIDIDISKIIDLEDIQLLGLQYSDGFWSMGKCSYNEHHFTNKNVQLTEYYVSICNNYKRDKIIDINKKFSHGVFDFEFGFRNKYTLLMPIIYNKYRKKSLSIEILSRFSNKQFNRFISGIIDGDGCVCKTGISICNYEDDGKDKYKIQQLLMWNNVYAYSSKNNIYIPKYNENLEFFDNININQSERKHKLKNLDTILNKNSPSKKLDKFIFDEFCIVKLKDIKPIDDHDMCDIETTSHFFACNGIKTHNCVGFDIPTIYNRMKKLGIDPNIMSPIGMTFINPYRYGDIFIGGVYPLDMLETYKTLTENKKESNKLGAISKIELGESKVEFEGSLDDLYETDIKRFIKYSGQDTNLLYELDKKLGHIELLNKMRQICHTTWKGTETTTGLLDPLLISFAKKRGMVMRNAENAKKEKYPGAYVITPKMGLYSWLVDFDYKGLYPSIIISCNIGPETLIGKIDPESAYKFIYKKHEFPNNISVIINPMVSKGSQKSINMSKDEFEEWIEDNDAIVTITGTVFIGHSKKLSFVSEVNQLLMNTRDVYKNKMKEERTKGNDIWTVYYNNQWAYKILGNSIYGFMALSSSRLFKIDLARSITLTGQELLKFAAVHLNNYMETGDISVDPDFINNFENMDNKYIIYGDTDSLFLNISEYLMDKNLL